jgi:hypothetical protein
VVNARNVRLCFRGLNLIYCLAQEKRLGMCDRPADRARSYTFFFFLPNKSGKTKSYAAAACRTRDTFAGAAMQGQIGPSPYSVGKLCKREEVGTSGLLAGSR